MNQVAGSGTGAYVLAKRGHGDACDSVRCFETRPLSPMTQALSHLAPVRYLSPRRVSGAAALRSFAFKRTASGRHSGLYEKRPGTLSYRPWPCEWRLRIFSLRPRRRWPRLLRLGEIGRLPRTRQWYFRRYLWLFGAHL
jgi:hypothetical protein